jgi:cytochrome c-type biogenesis protein CcmH/NrfF
MGVAALWFFGLLVVIVDIAATVDVIRRPDLRGGAKVLWVLPIFILPVIGVIAYVIARPSVVDFGENRDEAKKAASEAEAERARDRARDLGPTET